MRRDAREAVYRLVYSYYFTGEVDGENKEYFYKEHKLNDKDVEFADTLISATMEHEVSGLMTILQMNFTFPRKAPSGLVAQENPSKQSWLS